ncbi:MAG: hypothetical protein WD042_07790 [Phycisphaeraceae bacterium]
MLVTIVITLILIGVIDRLFLDTSNAVGIGVALNTITTNSSTIGNQLVQDAERMIGPNSTPGGFLVIVHRRYLDVKEAIPSGGERGSGNIVRSDMLTFFTDSTLSNATPFASIAPANGSTYYNDLASTTARVWYGHGLHVKPDGTASGTDLGQGLDMLSNQWILCRQSALLFDPGVFSAPPYNSYTHASNAKAGGVVSNTAYPDTPLQLRFALTDLIAQRLSNEIHTDIAGSYHDTARNYAYYVAVNRLRVNPTPSGSNMESWRIAQMHPYLAGNVSDFIVEFAADVAAPKDGSVDLDTSGNIKWYNGFDDETTLSAWNGGNTNYFPMTINGSGSTTDYSFVWRHDDDATTEASLWPHLIRVRYRMHDFAGKVAGAGQDNAGKPYGGVWFEQIIKVNRP